MADTAQDFLTHLQSAPTASLALTDWCASRFAAEGLNVRVLWDRPAEDAEARHRMVELRWGAMLVSRAENVYLPQRLAPEVRGSLLTTAIPFGVLLGPAGPQRRGTFARILPEGGDFMLEIRATLALPGQGDVASVHEFYHRALLGPPRRSR